ncbi:hypothetical protein [Chitinophaga filiformis]|uniref:Outer membrane protein beta-barrel domain-containing protein n=1 Tax=Chitinophaga filiformis TaxID=104663 RepID=A0A1G7MK69_CHIFI|nr:hypothetical protein [Chitinophaga filiformis]SDF62111.1 hypothetical protein SAMN04488121_102468 [Chitinophaga filiformis]
MKKIKMLFLVTSILCNVTFAQTRIDTNQTLSFDLLDPNGKFPSDFTIKKNVRLRYFIDNINRNVYAISTNYEAKSLFAEKPPIFGMISDIDLTKITAAVSNSAGLTGDALSTLTEQSNDAEKLVLKKYANTQERVSALIDAFVAKNTNLKKLNALYQSLTSMLQDGQSKFKTLYNEKLNATYAVLSTSFNYVSSSTDEAALLAALRKASSDLFVDITKDYNDLIRKYGDYKNQLAVVEVLGAAKIKMLTEYKAKKKKSESTEKEEKEIKGITEELSFEKSVSEVLSELVGDIKLSYAKVSEMEQKGFTENLTLVYRRINQANWQYISPSIKGQKDEIVVKLSIEPKEGSIHSPNYAQFNGEYTGDVYGFKVNFSTGLFVLIGKDLFNRFYRIDTIAGELENNIIVENDRKQTVQPAVGALMHFYNKRPGMFSWGGNFGFSVSDETRLNYHGGLSFLFGQEQRIIANIGVTLTRVEEINSAYKVGQHVSRSSGISTVPVEKFYKAGGFFAITYNLSN